MSSTHLDNHDRLSIAVRSLVLAMTKTVSSARRHLDPAHHTAVAAEQAWDLVVRLGLQGSPLRQTPDAMTSGRSAPAQYDSRLTAASDYANARVALAAGNATENDVKHAWDAFVASLTDTAPAPALTCSQSRFESFSAQALITLNGMADKVVITHATGDPELYRAAVSELIGAVRDIKSVEALHEDCCLTLDAVLGAARCAGWSFTKGDDGIIRMSPQVIGQAQTQGAPQDQLGPDGDLTSNIS